MDLLNLRLTWTYFQNNVKNYKKLHSTAMGSPVSVVVAEIVMQNVEEQALANNTRTIPLSLHYVDDTFTAVRGRIKMFYHLAYFQRFTFFKKYSYNPLKYLPSTSIHRCILIVHF